MTSREKPKGKPRAKAASGEVDSRGLPLTRAREQGETREKAVAEMAHKMLRGAWHPRATVQFANKFNVTVGTAKDWAGEASRQARALLDMDREEMRALLYANLEQCRRKALTMTKFSMTGDEYDAPDVRAAVMAIAEQGRLLGLIVNKTQDVSQERQAFEALPPAEQARELRKLEEKIAAERERLERESKS